MRAKTVILESSSPKSLKRQASNELKVKRCTGESPYAPHTCTPKSLKARQESNVAGNEPRSGSRRGLNWNKG